MYLKEKLEDELKKLTKRERDVMTLRLGLDNDNPRTIEETAQLYGVPKEAIRQIEIEVLQKSDVIVKETARAFAYINLLSCIFVKGIWNINSVNYLELKKDVDKIISENFNSNEIKVLDLRFGLTNGYQKTLNEIGEELNLSGERIRQIEGTVLGKLRNPKCSNLLEKYLPVERVRKPLSNIDDELLNIDLSK